VVRDDGEPDKGTAPKSNELQISNTRMEFTERLPPTAWRSPLAIQSTGTGGALDVLDHQPGVRHCRNGNRFDVDDGHHSICRQVRERGSSTASDETLGASRSVGERSMGREMNNCTSRRTKALAPLDVVEKALRDGGLPGERVLTVGTLIFSIAFCTLFFWAG
jgi:hypothetical protein